MGVTTRAPLAALLFMVVAGCGSNPVDPAETGDPVLTVTEPVDGAAINGMVRLRVTCSGDCQSIVVRTVGWHRTDEEVELARGERSIERDLPVHHLLSKDRYDRAWERIQVQATSRTGVTDTRVVDVFIFDAPTATEVIRTPGPVLDFDGTRVLYAEPAGDQWRILLGSGNPAADQLLRTGHQPAFGVIVNPDLVLFTVWRNRILSGLQGWQIKQSTSDTDSLFEWRSGTVSLLSATSNTRRPLVEDGLVAWQEGVRESGSFNPPSQMPLLIRDLATGATTALTTASTREGLDIGAGRTVVWTENAAADNLVYQVVRWRDGAVTRFTTDPTSHGHIVPKTDGERVVFQTYGCCRLELEEPAGRQVLADFPRPDVSSYGRPTYDVAAGFVAYTAGSGYEGWLRHADGSSTRIGTMPTGGRPPIIELVGGGGAVKFDDRIVMPGGETRVFGTYRARVVERNGAYFILYGNGVFRLN